MEAHATSQGSLTWLEGRGWLSSMRDAGPDISSGKPEKGPSQHRLLVTWALSHTLRPMRTVSQKLCEHQEPFQCWMLSGTVSSGVQATRGACDPSGAGLGGTECVRTGSQRRGWRAET